MIVKLGGLNVTEDGEPYTSPYYTRQIDDCIANAMPKGHYYVPGLGRTPQQQAAYMAQKLHRFDLKHDVLMLDNEKLDRNGVFWTQGDAVLFLRELQSLTGIPFKRMWHYAGAEPSEGGYRNRGPWDVLESLGVQKVWAAYNSGPPFTTGQRPTAPPDLRGSLTSWDVHQFTNNSAIPNGDGVGTTLHVDGNYARHSVEYLFDLAA